MEVKCEETAPRVARLLLQLHHAMHKQQQVKAPTATTAPAQRERCMGSSSTDSRPSNPHSFSRKALPDGPISSGFATTSFRVVVWLGWLRLIRSLCCAAFGHCVLRGLMLIVCVRHSSRGESRAVVTTERPPLQDCRAVSRVTQNSTLHQHEYATHETPRRRPHRQPIQLGGHYSPASGARPGPSSPLAAPASARRLSPYRQARLAQLHEMAAAFGFVEKGLEARTHVSSPSPHLTLLRLIAAVVTPLLDDPSPGSVRPEDRDPSLGAVSDRSRPPALDPDLDHIGVASPRPEATTGNATTTTNTTTDSTTTTTTTGPARKKHSQCGRQFGQRWPLDSWLPRARGDGPARRRDRGWRAPP